MTRPLVTITAMSAPWTWRAAKGPRVYDRASARPPSIGFFDGDEPTHHRWVLARRSLTRPHEIACYFAYAPVTCTVADLARVAGMRWAIEECSRRR